MIKTAKFALSFGTAVLLTVPSVFADRIENVTESFKPDGAERVEIDADFGMGRLVISTDDIEDVARFDVDYDTRQIRQYIDYSTRGSVGQLEFGAKNRRTFGHSDHVVNDWTIVLSTRYSTELTMDIGACEPRIDLGGIPLTDVALDIGAADGSIGFSKKNPARMEKLDLNIGASDIEVTDLGNANFEYMEFNCGAASAKLDFFGELTGTSEVRIEVGVGSADITIPKDLAVRIITDSGDWFSSVDFHHDNLEEVRKGVFESEGYSSAENRLLIDLEVGMGSVDLYFK